jgi:excisionase family DNA binding protein
MAALGLIVPEELVEAIAQRVADLLRDAGPPASTADDLLTVEEVAKYLRAARQRVYDLVNSGRLPVVRDGRRLLFRRSVIDAYLEDPAAGATS